jgi:hypothetical protein
MSYKDCLEKCIKIVVWSLSVGFVSYSVSCHFGWRNPIDLSTAYIIWIAWQSLLYIIVGSFVLWYWQLVK